MGKHLLRLARNGHLFLLGMASITNIPGRLDVSPRDSSDAFSPIGHDFRAVGEDIFNAMSRSQVEVLKVAPEDPKQMELSLR